MLRTIVVADNLNEWREKARLFLQKDVSPDHLEWSDSSHSQQALFAAAPDVLLSAVNRDISIPKAFLNLAESVAMHSDPLRWQFLYRTAWRLAHGERHLLQIDTDPDVLVLNDMRKAVERDIYKMRAFVRFRKVETPEGDQFIAWYQPQHQTLEANAKFFVDRFGSMRWGILTPQSSMLWDLNTLHFGPGVPRSQAPQEDELEDLWRLYYRTIYNPARLNLTAMRAQLPVFRWDNLPEARVIPELVRISRGTVQHMASQQKSSAAEWIPANASLNSLADAVRRCGACSLCSRATQPVWGEGNPQASIVVVGEQPGDEEDRSGRPFVGPAGQVLDQALAEAALSRQDLYVTNAVKAFRFEERGKRRIHQTPRSQDIETCRPWLLAELGTVKPKAVMCLGASAAQSVLGRKVQIGAERGKVFRGPGDAQVRISYHPSAILRTPDDAARRDMLAMLIADLAALKTAV